MRERKYTLPRHTNLAKQSSRTGAFFIDLAIALALTLGFKFLCFDFAFKKTLDANQSYINQERIYSGLYSKNNDDVEVLDSENVEDYVNNLSYYYINYLSGDNSKVKDGYEASKDRHESYTVEWFNKYILEIDESSSTSTFVYQKSGEVTDYTVLGIPNKDVNEDIVISFIRGKFELAITDDFNFNASIKEAGSKVMFLSALSFTLSMLIAESIVYLLMPFIFKNGQSIGKKVFGLGLADSDGFKMRNSQLFMRIVPIAVLTASVMFFYLVNLYLTITIFLIIFLVSFALSMSSPKKMSLHDYTAQTIVVDLKNSILFDDISSEEAYVAKEENLFDDLDENRDGEEPELSYEK